MLCGSGYVEWHQHNDGCQGRDSSRIHIKHSIENRYYTVFLNSMSYNEVSNLRRYYRNTKMKNAQQIWDKHFSLNNVLYFYEISNSVNPLNAELNPICYLLALWGAHHFPHVSRIRVNQQLTVVWAKQMSNLHSNKTPN